MEARLARVALDILAIVVLTVVLITPGAVFLVAGCRVSNRLTILALSIPVTTGLAAGTTVLCGVLGVRYGLPALLVFSGSATLICRFLVARSRLVTEGGDRDDSIQDRLRSSSPPTLLVGVVLAVGAVLAGTFTWLNGMAGLSTVPQEHDTVVHTLLVSYMQRSGDAAPWQLIPTDIGTGASPWFYPSGFHSVAVLLTDLGWDSIEALNAATVTFFVVVASIGVFTFSLLMAKGRAAPIFAGVAVLLSSSLYRPFFELAHDGGVLSFAASCSLVLAILFGLRALITGASGRLIIPISLSCVGLLAIHPQGVFVIGPSILILGAVHYGLGRRLPDRRTVYQCAAFAILTSVVSLPWLAPSVGASEFVVNFPESSPRWSLGDTLGRVVLFTDGGFLDVNWARYHLVFAAVFWLGFLGCLRTNIGRATVALWLFWALFALAYAAMPDLLFVDSFARLFYGSLNRIMSINWLFAPVVIAIGLAEFAPALLNRIESILARQSRVALSRTGVGLGVVGAFVLTYVLAGGLDYWRKDADSVAARYSESDFIRLSTEDIAAFDYLRENGDEVGRVMNNANDGSSYMYVFDGTPILNSSTLGFVTAPYGYYLLEHFNEIDENETVQCLVRKYHITHVFVSTTAPAIGAGGAPERWVGSNVFSFAPGLRRLEQVDALNRVYGNAGAEVYRVDPDLADPGLGIEPERCQI